MSNKCAVCGSNCEECPYFKKPCTGCRKVSGQTFWAADHFPNKTCPIYDCSINQKKHSDCGDCKALPCQTFVTLKDPSMTEVEFQEGLKKRVSRLHQKSKK